MVSRLAASLGPLGDWTQGVFAATGDALVATSEKAEPLIMRLDPERRAKVLMALLAVILVGCALIYLTILGGRRLRRIAKQLPTVRPPSGDDWYRKPLAGHDAKNGDNPNSEASE